MGEDQSVVASHNLSLSLISAMKVSGFKVPDDFNIMVPPNRSFGDLSADIALRAAEVNKTAPGEIAQAIVDHFSKPASVKKIAIAGAGYLNFTLSDSGWEELMSAWLSGRIFHSSAWQDQIVVVELSSPNVGKPFSVGHLRSTIIGDAVARLYEHSGAKTVRVNHLGDWGTQFGKLIYAINEWGDIKQIETDPVKEMLALYVKFHDEAEKTPELNDKARAIFARIEQGDEEMKQQWRQIIKWSLVEYNELYRRLGIKFDHLSDRGESFYTKEMMNEVLSELRSHKLVKKSDGAEVLFFPKDELPSTILVKSNGVSVYLLRDLAALKYRLTEWQADRIIYHVGSEQTLHFRQLIRAAELLGWLDEQENGRRPVVLAATHGMYRLATGKMSTRKGKGILLSDLLKFGVDQAETLIKSKDPGIEDKELTALAEIVSIGAIKYNDLAHNRTSPIIFEWGKALNLEGNSAPYLMYTHARAHGIFRQAKKEMDELNFNSFAITPRLALPKERDLILMIVPLHYAFTQATTKAMPSYVADALFDLAQKFNSYYNETKVITEDVALTEARLALVKIVADTIKDGLSLLGVSSPDKL